MRTIGAGIINCEVNGVAAGPHIIVVGLQGSKDAAAATNRVLVFDRATGILNASFGREGKEEGQLSGVEGMRVTPTGDHILIAEYLNDRVSKFTVEGAFVRCIGVGELKQPFDVELPSNGDILVADRGNHRICVFSSDGSTLLRSFGSQGETPGKFNFPIALAVHGKQLYVLDRDTARVQVFN